MLMPIRSSCPTQGDFYGTRTNACIRLAAEGVISNVAFGAMMPADYAIASTQNNGNQGLIQLKTDKLVQLKGISLVGNVKVSSEVNTGSYSAISLRGQGTSYFTTGHSYYVISPSSPQDVISTGFTGGVPSSGDAGSYSRFMNEPYNNIQ